MRGTVFFGRELYWRREGEFPFSLEIWLRKEEGMKNLSLVVLGRRALVMMGEGGRVSEMICGELSLP